MKRALPTLEEISQRLKSVDHMFLTLIKQRMDLALQVEEFKRNRSIGGEISPIIREGVEGQRLQQAGEWATEMGLNPYFVKSLYYQIISESCRVQLMQMQDPSRHRSVELEDQEYRDSLKKNLLFLTEKAAQNYDAKYRAHYPATQLYLDFELGVIFRTIDAIDCPRSRAVDLGCATGSLTTVLSPHFTTTIGYDISPHMIQEAKRKVGGKELDFQVHDFETGIPLDEDSVAFVVMNFGTASDIPNLKVVWSEVERILMPGGKYLFSFYNADALVYSWNFLPWPLPLAANVGIAPDTLEVHCEGKAYEIYARTYHVDQLSELVPRRLSCETVQTHPTLASILPEDAFNEPNAIDSIKATDELFTEQNTGSYIIVTGSKSEA